MSKDLTTGNLRNYNLIAGALHLVQMGAVLALANDFALPVATRYLTDAPGTGNFAEPITLMEAPVG